MVFRAVCFRAISLLCKLGISLLTLHVSFADFAGWKWGPQYEPSLKQHPYLRPFGEIAPTEQHALRAQVTQVLETWLGRGYRIQVFGVK